MALENRFCMALILKAIESRNVGNFIFESLCGQASHCHENHSNNIDMLPNVRQIISYLALAMYNPPFKLYTPYKFFCAINALVYFFLYS